MEKKTPRLGASVLVKHENKYLLGKRNKENANGKWIIPGGGINWGETSEQAAIREIKEETGIDVKIKKLICIKEIIATHADYHSIVFFYLAEPISKKIIASEDVSEARYFSIEEIKELDVVQSVKDVFLELKL